MISNRLLECLEVPGVVEAQERLSSLQLFLYHFQKTPGVRGEPNHLQDAVEACKYFCMIFQRLLECLESLNIFHEFWKLSNVCQACIYVCMIVKTLLECLEVSNIFQQLQKFRKDCQACNYFCTIFKALLECLESLNIFQKLQKLVNIFV